MGLRSLEISLKYLSKEDFSLWSEDGNIMLASTKGQVKPRGEAVCMPLAQESRKWGKGRPSGFTTKTKSKNSEREQRCRDNEVWLKMGIWRRQQMGTGQGTFQKHAVRSRGREGKREGRPSGKKN